VLLMMLGTQWYLLFNVLAGAAALPGDLKEVAQVQRLTRADRWFKLYLPGVFPALVTGLITAAGGAWNATVVAEYVVLPQRTLTTVGIGATISQATADGNYPLLCASVAVMALGVVVLNRILWKPLFQLAERRYTIS